MRSRAVFAILLSVSVIRGVAAETNHTFAIGDTDFLLDGQKFQIRSGEMHAPRIPPEYWRHRLKMVKAMGCNAVCAYLFWNLHEPQPGQFNFSGDADAAQYCKIAQEEGLWIILRPGPYACAEWEFGGLPWWLLKDPEMKVRTQYPPYLDAVHRYLGEVGKQLAPLQITRGGPIIMVQCENEYGSYGNDKEYVGKVRDALKDAGFNVPFFTCDGPSQLKADVRDDIFCVVNFGGDPNGGFKALRAIRAKGPLMCGEFYPGWFDSWGSRHHYGNAKNILHDLETMLAENGSFSIYMVHGGTTFGLWSGANAPPYRPQTSSYDYDAPISEAGWATPKFHEIRALFAKHLNPGEKLTDIPPQNPVIEIPSTELKEAAPVFANLPAAKRDQLPRTMEEYDQAYGCILYRTKLPAGPAATLNADTHDWAQVFLDGKRVDILDRLKGRSFLRLPARASEATLDILVEAMGRVNYGGMIHDHKGINGRVELRDAGGDTHALVGWEIFNLPLDATMLTSLKYSAPKSGPAFYRGTLNITTPGDTFLDMRPWRKGCVWVNGHNLGRFWRIGPTQTMFLPGCWLKPGANEIIVLELDAPEKPVIAGLKQPVLDEVQNEASPKHRKKGQTLKLAGLTPVLSGSLKDETAWQQIRFTPAHGRYFCVEALDSFNGDNYTTLAELQLLDENGKELPREGWSVAYADSEETDAENSSADLVFDLQPTTFWHTQWDGAQPPHPHQLVIDLGKEQTITGAKFLLRQDQANGRIKNFRIFTSSTPFPGL